MPILIILKLQLDYAKLKSKYFKLRYALDYCLATQISDYAEPNYFKIAIRLCQANWVKIL